MQWRQRNYFTPRRTKANQGEQKPPDVISPNGEIDVGAFMATLSVLIPLGVRNLHVPNESFRLSGIRLVAAEELFHAKAGRLPTGRSTQ